METGSRIVFNPVWWRQNLHFASNVNDQKHYLFGNYVLICSRSLISADKSECVAKFRFASVLNVFTNSRLCVCVFGMIFFGYNPPFIVGMMLKINQKEKYPVSRNGF